MSFSAPLASQRDGKEFPTEDRKQWESPPQPQGLITACWMDHGIFVIVALTTEKLLYCHHSHRHNIMLSLCLALFLMSQPSHNAQHRHAM